MTATEKTPAGRTRNQGFTEGSVSRYRIVDGQVGPVLDTGHTFSATITHHVPGFTDVLVTLTGWGLDYSRGDHRISRAGVRIKDAEYDGGTVRFVVEGSGRDSTAANDYRWTVWYSLLCLGG